MDNFEFNQWNQSSLSSVVMLVVGYNTNDQYVRGLAKKLLLDFTLWLKDHSHPIFTFDELSLIYNKFVTCREIKNNDDLQNAFHYLNTICLEIREIHKNQPMKYHNVLTIVDYY